MASPDVAPTPPRIPTGIVWDLPGVPAEPEDLQAGGPSSRALAVNLAAETVFGALPSPAVMFMPTPSVTLGGAVFASGPVGGVLPGQVVVDGVRTTWGRTAVMDQAEPPTGTLELFDSTKTWATTRNLVGQPVLLSWSGVGQDGVAASSIYFRGRVSTVTVRRKSIRNPAGDLVHGSLVTLGLVSVLNDLANMTPTAAWPEETMTARAQRIQGSSGGILTAFYVRDYWLTPNTRPYDANKQRTIYEHTLSMYDSAGADRFVFNQNGSWADYMPRRNYYGNRGMAQLWWHVASESAHFSTTGKGAYIRALSMALSGGAPGDSNHFDAHDLEDLGVGTLTRGPAQRVSRTSVTNPDGSGGPTGGFPDRTVVTTIPGVNETTEGIRVAQLDSVITWNAWADQSGGDLQALASNEGAAWLPGSWVFDTGRTGGFHGVSIARQILTGTENTTLAFIQRSWLPEYGLRPIYAIMGGEIEYRDNRWIVTMNPGPVTSVLPQHAISWEEIDDGSAAYQVEWWDDDNPRGMHETMTLDDLGFVASGMGVTTIPPDQGWDQPIS